MHAGRATPSVGSQSPGDGQAPSVLQACLSHTTLTVRPGADKPHVTWRNNISPVTFLRWPSTHEFTYPALHRAASVKISWHRPGASGLLARSIFPANPPYVTQAYSKVCCLCRPSLAGARGLHSRYGWTTGVVLDSRCEVQGASWMSRLPTAFLRVWGMTPRRHCRATCGSSDIDELGKRNSGYCPPVVLARLPSGGFSLQRVGLSKGLRQWFESILVFLYQDVQARIPPQQRSADKKCKRQDGYRRLTSNSAHSTPSPSSSQSLLASFFPRAPHCPSSFPSSNRGREGTSQGRPVAQTLAPPVLASSRHDAGQFGPMSTRAVPHETFNIYLQAHPTPRAAAETATSLLAQVKPFLGRLLHAPL
ncbi:hypothetical protein LZ30DRAFT_296655 [Colletotrichum cereale]|nr:hypothetical protein LZ30DRAFT_296655 [Colletotrichum cereale]